MPSTNKQKKKIIKTGLSVFLLAVYLFGSFAAYILHPLHHCNENHSCHSTNELVVHQQTTSASNALFFTTSDSEKGGVLTGYCAFCHFDSSNLISVEPENTEAFIQNTDFHFCEYICDAYHYTFFTHTRSRASPLQIV